MISAPIHLRQQLARAIDRRRARPRASRRSCTTRSAASSMKRAVIRDPLRGQQIERDAACECSPGRNARRAAPRSRTCRSSLRSSRRYGPTLSGGTAESSQPSQVTGSPGTQAVAPRPDSRISQTSCSSRGIVVELHRGRVAALLAAVHQPARLVVGLFLVFAAEFDQQPAAPFGQQLQVARMQALHLHVLDRAVSSTPRRPIGLNSRISGT